MQKSTPVTQVLEFSRRIRGSALVNSVCTAFQARGNTYMTAWEKVKAEGEVEAEGGESAKTVQTGLKKMGELNSAKHLTPQLAPS